jgi:signal transduction histidine kinase
MTYLNTLANTGVQYAGSPSERRSIYLSNTISITFAFVGLLMSGLYYLWYGSSTITLIIAGISVLCLSTLIFNSLNLSVVSRLWLCILIPVAVISLSLYSKTLYYANSEQLDYFTYRVVILSSCIFPPVFFSLREKWFLIGASTLIFLILFLHDPLHEYFGVPYRAGALSVSSYQFSNIVFMMMYLLMTGAVFFMKSVSEGNERKTEILIRELNASNKKLTEKNREIESRSQEILVQTDKLNESQRKLKDAYETIEEQRNLLFVQNQNMSMELIAKNRELTETNHELIKHNNELRQFSYTVSHNLRGPVASLMGLLKLFQPENLSPDNAEIFHHIETSTQRLDNIIKDLSKIIDIRNDIFQIRQQIDLAFEVQEILSVLNREIISQNILIHKNIEEGRVIYSVRPMVHSILYNLISNALKYRSPDRRAVIEISSSEDVRNYYITVRDNGMGIDMERDRDNLFKLYKRFHHHTEGKGLGLYLVKMQAEALGGNISVTSELDKFTEFKVRLKKPENADRQILYQGEKAEIFFDATLNCLGVSWRKPDFQEYKTLLKKVLDFIKVYNTPNFITDRAAESFENEQARYELLRDVLQEASKNGLRRLAAVLAPNELLDDNGFTEMLAKFGLEVRYFNHYGDAIGWISQFDKHTST